MIDLSGNLRTSDTSRTLDAETTRAVRVFLTRLINRYRVVDAIVFGSRARLTHEDDSDADLAVILDGDRGNRNAIAQDMAGIAFDVMMETNVLVSALPLWADEFANPSMFSNPDLIVAIRRDGLRP